MKRRHATLAIYAIPFLLLSAAAIIDAQTPAALTPTPEQVKDLKIAQQERTIQAQATQIAYDQWQASQAQYRQADAAMRSKCTEVIATNKWAPDTVCNFDVTPVTFTAATPKPPAAPTPTPTKKP
jgi:hypothetical protein